MLAARICSKYFEHLQSYVGPRAATLIHQRSVTNLKEVVSPVARFSVARHNERTVALMSFYLQ